MIEIVYHGSYAKIDDIDLSFCHIGRDFGRGFYVTNIRSQAECWAIRKGKWRNTQGVITEFGLHKELIKILKLRVLRFKDCTEEWLNFVVANRDNKLDKQAHDYDIVEGPVADDEVATRIRDYLRGDVSKEQLLIELMYKSPSHQICFCTERSLRVLITEKDKVDGIFAHTDSDIVKNLMIDFGKNEAEAMDIYYTSKTYTKLADETTKLYQKDWAEIYELLKQELKNHYK
jgi:hypothetical protein